MYLTFYGFKEKPFNPTPDPRFLYMTPGHREALAQLQYGVQVLSFVEDKNGVLACPLALDEEVVQPDEPLGPRFSRFGDPEVLERVFQDSVEGQGGIEHEGHLGLSIEPLQQCV